MKDKIESHAQSESIQFAMLKDQVGKLQEEVQTEREIREETEEEMD